MDSRESAGSSRPKARSGDGELRHSYAQYLDRPIVLVGLMGVGKSTVGRSLAKRLGLPFVDSDATMEDASGLSAAGVFERHGEEHYRESERRLVMSLVDGQVRVIATGGGAFVDSRTRDMLNAHAITIWLDAPIEILTKRTSRCDTRPLLRNSDPKSTLERLAKERQPFYASAQFHVKSGNDTPRAVVDSILKVLEKHLGRD